MENYNITNYVNITYKQTLKFVSSKIRKYIGFSKFGSEFPKITLVFICAGDGVNETLMFKRLKNDVLGVISKVIFYDLFAPKDFVKDEVLGKNFAYYTEDDALNGKVRFEGFPIFVGLRANFTVIAPTLEEITMKKLKTASIIGTWFDTWDILIFDDRGVVVEVPPLIYY